MAGGLPPASLTFAHVADVCRGWEHLAPGTRIGYHVGVRHWLRYLGASAKCDEGIPHVTSPDSPTRVVDDVEFESVLAIADPALALMLLLTRDGALRAATAYSITGQDIHSNMIRAVTKWDGTIVVPMSARLGVLAHAAKGRARYPDTPLVCALGVPQNKWISSTLRHRLDKAQARVGAGDWTWHDLRRTAAQQLYRTTGDLRRVQALLGHKSLLASLHYLNADRAVITPTDVLAFTSKGAPKC